MKLLDHRCRVWYISFVLFTCLQSVTPELGPQAPPTQETRECSRDSSCSETGGYSEPHEKEKYFRRDEADSQSENEEAFELAEVPEEKPGFVDLLYNAASSGISTVYRSAKSAKDRIVDKGADVVSDFADKVRDVIHEEVYDLLERLLTTVGSAFTTPGLSHAQSNYGVFSHDYSPLHVHHADCAVYCCIMQLVTLCIFQD